MDVLKFIDDELFVGHETEQCKLKLQSENGKELVTEAKIASLKRARHQRAEVVRHTRASRAGSCRGCFMSTQNHREMSLARCF